MRGHSSSAAQAGFGGSLSGVPMQSNLASITTCLARAEPENDLLKALPRLQVYAKSLCRSTDRADDLVQETLVKALANIDTFEPGSNMIAWLYAILRNGFYSEYRKRRREVEDDEGRYAALLRIFPAQEDHVYLLDVHDALARLTPEHREALMLVVSGLSYDEAAVICRCAAGTVKSRVSRARDRLTQMLGHCRPAEADYGPVPGGALRFDISMGAAA
jgi:RNA polymerase sigma-70 factor (ECF subfamily)